MWIIIFSLILGLLIGNLQLLPEYVLDLADYLVLGGLLLLLFTMGLQIGADPQIVNSLNQIGLNAFILALGSVLGSIIIMLVFELSSQGE
ncbi:hypothetical protein JCM16358_22400 [Halanaerocella petrolearia]